MGDRVEDDRVNVGRITGCMGDRVEDDRVTGWRLTV